MVFLEQAFDTCSSRSEGFNEQRSHRRLSYDSACERGVTTCMVCYSSSFLTYFFAFLIVMMQMVGDYTVEEDVRLSIKENVTCARNRLAPLHWLFQAEDPTVQKLNQQQKRFGKHRVMHSAFTVADPVERPARSSSLSLLATDTPPLSFIGHRKIS